jgi:hypothetical protein
MKKVILLWTYLLALGSIVESNATVVSTRLTHFSYAKPKVYQKKKGFFSFLKRKKKCKCPPLPS